MIGNLLVVTPSGFVGGKRDEESLVEFEIFLRIDLGDRSLIPTKPREVLAVSHFDERFLEFVLMDVDVDQPPSIVPLEIPLELLEDRCPLAFVTRVVQFVVGVPLGVVEKQPL